MPVYGFRLFTFNVFPSRTQAAVDLEDCAGNDFLDVSGELLRSMQGKTLIWPPQQTEAETPLAVSDTDEVVETEDQARGTNPHAGKKALLVDLLAEDEHTVYGEVLVGTFGDHDVALTAPELVEVSADQEADSEEPPSGKGTDLKGTAPARRYRFIINVPPKGKTGLIVMEDISRGCPVDLLVRWMNRHGMTNVAERIAAMPVKPKRSELPHWWRTQHHPAVDQDYFQLMVAQGQLERVELIQHAVSSGANRPKTRFKLTAPKPDQKLTGDFVELLSKWVSERQELKATRPVSPTTGRRPRQTKDEREAAKLKIRQEKIDSDADAARSMAAILGPEIEEIGFDDGYLVLNDGDRTKQISPSRISELFTYEVSRDGRPSNVAFYTAARTKALALQTPLELALTWPQTINMEGDDDAEPGPSQPPPAA